MADFVGRAGAKGTRWLVAALDPLDPGLAGGKFLIRLCEVGRRLAFLGWVLCRVMGVALLPLISLRCIQPVHRRVVGFGPFAGILGVLDGHGFSCSTARRALARSRMLAGRLGPLLLVLIRPRR